MSVSNQSRQYGDANPTTGTVGAPTSGSFVFGDSISAVNVSSTRPEARAPRRTAPPPVTQTRAPPTCAPLGKLEHALLVVIYAHFSVEHEVYVALIASVETLAKNAEIECDYGQAEHAGEVAGQRSIGLIQADAKIGDANSHGQWRL